MTTGHLLKNQFCRFLAAAGLLAGLAGCGVIKNREDRVVIANENPGSEQAGISGGRGRTQEDEEIRQIKEFLDLYTDHGAITREGLANFFEKYKDKIAPFLAGLHMSSQDLINLVFQFDANHDGHITPQEISDGLMKRIPILRWIPDNASSISRAELLDKVTHEYPLASQAATQGLTEVLMRFDQTWAGGNGDGKVSRAELSGAGLIIGFLAQTDFQNGFTIPSGVVPPIETHTPGPDGSTTIDLTPVVGKLLQQKVNQQLFLRYPDSIHTVDQLSADDQRMEWTQVILTFFLADKLNPIRAWQRFFIFACQLTATLRSSAISEAGVARSICSPAAQRINSGSPSKAALKRDSAGRNRTT
jgi:hypothetical protein